MEDKLKREIRNFGLTLTGVLIIIGTVPFIIKHRDMLTKSSKILYLIALILGIISLICPQILKLIFNLWMKFVKILGWFNTRLLLGIIYYLLFTPAAIILKIFGKDPMDRKFDKTRDSYWREKKKIDRESLLKQY